MPHSPIPNWAANVELNHPLLLHAIVMVDIDMSHTGGHGGFWDGRKAALSEADAARAEARAKTRDTLPPMAGLVRATSPAELPQYSDQAPATRPSVLGGADGFCEVRASGCAAVVLLGAARARRTLELGRLQPLQPSAFRKPGNHHVPTVRYTCGEATRGPPT